ncbi:nucleoside-diphosphate sugar epimerase/dehydratase [Paenibacillus sp. BC26]|uniref:polysaccharide biosynthesis protein n=1 Tax=Paenibacillus sp. BC26 TaxID=1881032 RepID=UPI0008E468B6|nr:nucleoside-diphosphate sugar epimerase/dehydratase [Paenibacillus sp. BC26]SFT25308.1 NDP-sugar epimerase, includes UDP-GlcNAc-inverting 4,6-dehydratase FlaA1 and capsular polysaccharide biosynthesis protein EpsC [Paenibacillus sp. BC26]
MLYRKRSLILMGIDSLIVFFSVGTSYLFRYEGNIPAEFVLQMLVYALVTAAICNTTMVYFKMYQRLWRYASIGELVSLLRAVILGWVISYGLTIIFMDENVPLPVAVRTMETMLLIMGGIRFIWRMIMDSKNTAVNKSRVLIIGAGDCGAIIAKEIKSNANAELYVVGFIDDDKKKLLQRILGIPVLGDRYAIEAIVRRHKINEIIIAIPSAGKSELTDIISICRVTGAKVKIIPALNDLIAGKVSVSAMRDIDLEDLLGRDPILPDLKGIADYVENKVVLVTGAGGSIGSELCRQLTTFKPKTLMLLGHGENSIYTIEMELRRRFPDLELETIIADIQDRQRIDDVFRIHRPQVVFHAAAHKHVPLMERNPAEAVKNNVFGTKNVADAADRYEVERFVLISSDKAVNPSSIMGATKRIAEMYIQMLDQVSHTKYVAVRFGNVLGSRGSVIPRFKEQIAAGGPVTVTHPEMVRYFMTIPEAVQLVIQAGAFAAGGEIFVLDMGQPVKIVELAEDVIRLSGFEPYTEIPIEFTGIRAGEKLYEELLLNEEAIAKTKHNRIFIGRPVGINQVELELQFKRLERAIDGEKDDIRNVIEYIVPLFKDVS